MRWAVRRILIEFSHKAGLGVQTSGSVDDYVIRCCGRRAACRACVEQDGGAGSPPGRVLMISVPVRCPPDFELLDGRGTEGVGGAQQDIFSLGAENLRQLAYGRCLSRAIHFPTTRITSGEPSTRLTGRELAAFRVPGLLLFEQALEFFYIFDLFAIGFFPQLA